jgi:hypothetical protein
LSRTPVVAGDDAARETGAAIWFSLTRSNTGKIYPI